MMTNTVLSSHYIESLLSAISFRYKNPECFQLNSVQCNHLRDALVGLSTVLLTLDNKYVFGGKNMDFYPNALKEIYRVVKEAEIYLYHCSTGDWPITFLTRLTTAEAYSLHLHHLALCRLLLHVILRADTGEICRQICHFDEEMDRFTKIRHEYADEVQLIKTCQQFAERSTHTIEDKNIVEVSKFLGEKLKGITPIPVSAGVESENKPIPTWLKLNPEDLVLKSEIGEGSFGHVYEGLWLGIRVAAKEMPMDYGDVFESEASILAKLQSPFIVHLIGTCVQDSHLYLVMELVSSNLEQLLENRKSPLPLHVAVDIMLQISRAMEYLHSQGIMHLDLKAANVLFELSSVPELREEGYGRVKLCDFGTASARLFSFRTPEPKGTCYWRAPEVFPRPDQDWSAEASTPQKYTNKADVYSFAMTCYEILTGKQPFAGALPPELYTKIVNGERPPLELSICPFILANYIQLCWETDPNHRPCFEAVSNFLRKLKLIILRCALDRNNEDIDPDEQALTLMHAWERETENSLGRFLEERKIEKMITLAPKAITPAPWINEAEVLEAQWMDEAMTLKSMVKARDRSSMMEALGRERMMEAGERALVVERIMEALERKRALDRGRMMEARKKALVEERMMEALERKRALVGERTMEAGERKRGPPRERTRMFPDFGWRLGRGRGCL